MGAPEEQVAARLDVIAQVLIGTFAAMAGLLTLVGANSDRVWVWLDQDGQQKWLVGAGLLGVAAIALALLALVTSGRAVTVVWLGLASVCYVSALVTALLGASQAADSAGRPTFAEVSLTTEGATSELAFTVRAESVDQDQRVRVEVRNGSGQPVMSTVVRPSALGVVEFRARIPSPPGPVTIVAARSDDPLGDCPNAEDQADHAIGPTCVMLRP